MSTQVVAEHFTLTPALRETVNREFERALEALPRGTNIRLFLSMEPHHQFLRFRALCTAHIHGRDVVVKESGPDLYRVISRTVGRLGKSAAHARQRRRACLRKKEAIHE